MLHTAWRRGLAALSVALWLGGPASGAERGRGLVPVQPAASLAALASLEPLARQPAATAAPADVSSTLPRGSSVDAGPDAWFGPLGPSAAYAPDERLGRGRGLWLGVSAGVAGSPGQKQRVFGLLELGMGLDDWVGGRTPPAPEPDVSEQPARPEPARPERGALAEGAAFGALRRTLPPEAATAAVSVPLARAACTRARACDPAGAATLARALVAEALRVQGGGRALERLDAMAARSRAAASLPEVRLGAGTSRDESLRLNPTIGDPARYTRDGGRDLWLEARLTWRLDGAIFASDEIAIMRLRAQERQEAARLTEDVLAALLDWQRARLALAGGAALPEEIDQASVRQFGAVTRLDVLTDGWFTRYLQGSAQAPP